MSPHEGSFDSYNDPLRIDFELYDMFLRGLIEDCPEIPTDLTADQRKLLDHRRAFLEWKYSDGLDESATRDQAGYQRILQIRALPETAVETGEI